MTKPVLTRALLIGAATIAVTLAIGKPDLAPAADPSTGLLARGEYLTGNAGQCADCHGAGLVGGPNRIPGPPGVPWASAVPSLHGLVMFPKDEEAIAFLTTAVLPNGKPALDPMPRYKFNHDDAVAIVAYLRSLK